MFRDRYTCVAGEVSSTEKLRITAADGKHLNDRSNADVLDLEIRDGELRTLPAGLGEVFPNLRSLRVMRTKVGFIDDDCFEKLGGLREISFTSTELKELREDTFSALTNLESVSFLNNKFTEIDGDTFDNNKIIKAIDFRNNMIAGLPADLFENNGELREINFDGNNIKVLEANTFKSNTKLRTIKFARNRLEKIEAQFDALRQLALVDFTDNKCIRSSFNATLGTFPFDKMKAAIESKC